MSSDLSAHDELRKRLRRIDVLLLRAVRRMRGRPQNTARGEHWGALITDDEQDELLREAGELGPAGVPGESERRLERAIKNAEALRDAPGAVMDALRARHGLDGTDVDILLLALAPDVFEGYGRILAFLNDYAVMPWATVDLIARVLETRRVNRLAVLERLLPAAPLVRGGLLTLHPLDPVCSPFAFHRVQVERGTAATLLGLESTAPRPPRPALALVEEGDEEPSLDERVDDLPSVERRSLFRELVRKWRDFVSGAAEGRDLEPTRAELGRAEPEAARLDLARAGWTTRLPQHGPQSATLRGLTMAERAELTRRLRRADLHLLHAIRMHREQPWVGEAARGKELMNLSLITEREVQDLLFQHADPYLRGSSGLEPLLEQSRLSLEQADGRFAELAARTGLSPLDLDLIALALLPEISSGYRRIFLFLNTFQHDHLTVGLLARLCGANPAARQEVRERLGPEGPLVRWEMVQLNPGFPAQDHLPSLRVALSEGLVQYLLGQGDPPGRRPGKVLEFAARRR